MGDDVLVKPDTEWFSLEPEKYLLRPDFQRFQEISGVNFRDLLSIDPDVIRDAQERLARKCKFINEMRSNHAGPWMPIMYYTGVTDFASVIPEPIPELDNMWLRFDMGDSLRRRNIALSQAILPETIRQLYQDFRRQIRVVNFGSGAGLDTTRAAVSTKDLVSSVDNYDLNQSALEFGQKMSEYLERLELLEPGLITFHNTHMARCKNNVDLGVLIGVICSMNDYHAEKLIDTLYDKLNPGGVLVVSSSNYRMRCEDPLPNFLLQHFGSSEDPMRSWGLNFRTKEKMREAFKRFRQVDIYDDSNYPGREHLKDKILSGADTLPVVTAGYKIPLSYTMPDQSVLRAQKGYNWLAVAKK